MIMQNDYNQADIEFLRNLMGLSESYREDLKNEIKQTIGNTLKQEILNDIDLTQLKQEVLTEIDTNKIKDDVLNEIDLNTIAEHVKDIVDVITPAKVRFGVYEGELSYIPNNIRVWQPNTGWTNPEEGTEETIMSSSKTVKLQASETLNIPLINLKRKIVKDGVVQAFFVPIKATSTWMGTNAWYNNGSILVHNLYTEGSVNVGLGSLKLEGLIIDFRDSTETLDATSWSFKTSGEEVYQ